LREAGEVRTVGIPSSSGGAGTATDGSGELRLRKAEERAMRKTMPTGIVAALVVGTWACAGTPGPGDAEYPFNLLGTYAGEVVVEGMAFSFEMDIQTHSGGGFDGSYVVTSPISTSGPLVGTIVADTARFSLDYLNPTDGCGGNLDATGTVEPGGGSLAGRVRVNDSCNGYLSGTFSVAREGG